LRSKPEILYKSYVLSNSIVHTVTIPNHKKFTIATATESKLDRLDKFARKHQAIAIVNAGFFDPKNQKTTSYVFSKRQLVEDPRENQRLVNNPNLMPQMKQILDRSEFRSYFCGREYRYDIVLHNETIPSKCQLVDAVGAGPQLLPKITDTEEAFVTYEGQKVIKDALGSDRPNARSAVGITRDRQVIFLMVAQKPNSPSNSGMSFQEMATFFKNLGAEKAMNLDGGSSASLYYEGKTFYGKVDKEGNLVKRPVKSVLLVKESS
jgi:exopolysaccharide biosynthesis protein